MNALEVAKLSLDAWNRRDADAIGALYAEGGTYITPRADQVLTGPKAVADFAKKVFTVYPDFSMETISVGDTGGGLIASLFASRLLAETEYTIITEEVKKFPARKWRRSELVELRAVA